MGCQAAQFYVTHLYYSSHKTSYDPGAGVIHTVSSLCTAICLDFVFRFKVTVCNPNVNPSFNPTMKNQNTGLQAGIIQIDWQSFTTRQQLNLMLFKIFSYEQLRNDFNQNIKNLWSHFHCGRKILTQGAFAGAFSHISQSASKVKNESWCFNINVHSTYNPLVPLCVKRHISTQKASSLSWFLFYISQLRMIMSLFSFS